MAKNKVEYADTLLERVFPWQRFPKGEVGIEVEVEGGPWPEEVITNWTPHADGSLRNGIEYVIRQPVMRDRVRAALDTLVAGLAGRNLVFSFRTSIHVHINVQDLTVRQWVNFISLFCIFEEALVNVVGPERAGNKFCLRLKDAEEPLQRVVDGLKAQNLGVHINGDLKYASMNVKATRTHGTLEFRAMRGNLDPAFINDWVMVLIGLKDAAKKVTSPTLFVEELSIMGPAAFAAKYLPVNNTITRGVLMQADLNDLLYGGVRLAQDLAYSQEWSDPGVADSPRRRPDEIDEEAIPAPDGLNFLGGEPADIRWVINPPPFGAPQPARPPRRRRVAPVVPPAPDLGVMGDHIDWHQFLRPAPLQQDDNF